MTTNLDVIFYTTATGNLGASLDGEILVNHLGRRLPISDAWQETDAELDDLTDECWEAIEEEADREERIAANRAEVPKRIKARKEARRKENRRVMVDFVAYYEKIIAAGLARSR